MANDVHQKALEINLDSSRYGSFAEIGAGQEVARWFFRVGAAAGTIAKSVSAYDMKVSDAIYGKPQRYVSRSRLVAMLEREHALNLERLSESRGSDTAFFAFADTVAAQSYSGTSDCHAWMGIRFQASPGAGDSQIVLHVRMLDSQNLQQQEALGIIGVNLVYGAFHHAHEPRRLIESLLDDLSTDRIEVDMIAFSGEAFREVDNRVMALKLVQLGLTPAAMFAASGEALHISEVIYGKPVLVQRGRFRPPTLVNRDMQLGALSRFLEEPEVEEEAVVSLLEMTLPDLSVDGEIEFGDFLGRIDVLSAGKFSVLISNYTLYFRLAEYLARNTRKPIGIALGIRNVRDIFDEKHYQELGGGILEATGRLFKNQLRLFVYPALEPGSGELVTADSLEIESDINVLYRYLVEHDYIRAIEGFDEKNLQIHSEDVLLRIRSGDPSWAEMVPPLVAKAIKSRRLFGSRG
ncbi:MAG: hypothetical protein BMS9Abin37_0555 [Acidobacteriota bacterium]|nr:MAG: hypothetical protein BMS9Abin37_0555 [Acidobacteriota bacterium]